MSFADNSSKSTTTSISLAVVCWAIAIPAPLIVVPLLLDTTLIFNTDGNEKRLISAIKQLICRRVDGVILDVSNHREDFLKPLKDHQIQTVIFGLQSEDYDSISCDDIKGSYELAKSLYNFGARKFTYFCPQFNRNIYSKRRYEGISRLSYEYNDFDLEVIDFEGNSSIENGYKMMENYLNKNDNLPDAIMVFNDIIAVGVIKCLQHYNLKVPEDIYVSGFDNLETVLFPLDTVDIPVYEMG